MTASVSRLLVVLEADGLAPALVAYGERLHRALGGTWSVVAVETLESGARPESERASQLEAIERAESLGATVSHLSTGSFSASATVSAIVHRARAEAADGLLLGRPRPRGAWHTRPASPSDQVDAIGELLPGVAVHVLHASPAAPHHSPAAPPHRAWPTEGWGLAAFVVGVCTLICAALEPLFHPANLVMVYLAGVVFVATRGGRSAAVAAVLASVFFYDLVIVPPRWSLKPTEPQYWLAFVVMLAVGLIIGQLAARGREQAATAEARARRANAMAQFALRLAKARSDDAVVAELRAALRRALGVESVVLHAGFESGALPDSVQRFGVDPALAARVLREGRVASGTASSAGTAPLRYLPLVAGASPIGVVVVEAPDPRLDSFEDEHVARALTHQAAVALERAMAEQRSAAAAVDTERERTRNTLLAAISHDFRTPLTTIMGNATTLVEQGASIDPPGQRRLLSDLLAEAQRLDVLTSNLLELTRIEEGAIRLAPEWCPADELLAEASAALRRRLAAHRVEWDSPADALVWCDPRLVGQVLANLLDNAARHTPAGGHIRASIECDARHWCLVVQDSGPGIAAGQELAVFRKFHRLHADGDSTGKGLGLAICAAVAELHGGSITVANEGGARFVLCLPQPVTHGLPVPELA